MSYQSPIGEKTGCITKKMGINEEFRLFLPNRRYTHEKIFKVIIDSVKTKVPQCYEFEGVRRVSSGSFITLTSCLVKLTL